MTAFGEAMTTQAGRDAFKPMPALMANFWRVGGENLKLIQEGRKDEAIAFLVEQTIPARNALLQPLMAERERQSGRLNAEVTFVRDEALFARNLVLGIVMLVSVGVVGYALYGVRVMRRLGGEPDELKRVADAVSAGDLTLRVPLRAGDTSSVMASLARMADQLALTVRTVRQNADSAFQANQLAANSSAVAAQGGEMVQAVVSTMREIKGLIGISVEPVEKGSQLVDQAGATMQEIVASIRRVTYIVGEISAASTEQSEGVAQVGLAVTQMDQATQQNAALVEQSAASAESLKQQSQQLVQAVAMFRLA